MAPTKTADHTPVYDADAHICEPPSIWTEYCDPKYRDLIIRADVAPNGKDSLFANGEATGASAAMACIPDAYGTDVTWDDIVPGSYDPTARLGVMDDEGLDAALMFPSLDLLTGEIADADVAAANARAYNRWMIDFVDEDRERLFGRIRSTDLVERGYRTRFLQHLTLPEIHEVVPESRGWFSFAFVRNPWDRMASIHGNPDPQLVRVGRNRGLHLDELSFEEFVQATADLDHAHLAPQVEYLVGEDGELLVDLVGRFEELEQDFARVCQRLGVSSRLPHANPSPARRKRRHYHSLYSPRTRELVAERYRRDIEAFGYSF